MTKTLITGAGGPAAICFYEALPEGTTEVFMADADPMAAGLYLVDQQHRMLVPMGADPDFVPRLLALCLANGITQVLPTVDAELLPLALERCAFEREGIKLLMPSLLAVSTCVDKFLLYQACRLAVPCPKTWVPTGHPPSDLDAKYIVKPRTGSGSRGIRLIDGSEVASLGSDESLIVQEYLPGDEYSVDVLIHRKTVLAAVPRLRMKVDSGVAVAAKTVHDEDLIRLASKAALHCGIEGVCNVQLRRDVAGQPRLMEINPRFPGTMALTVAAGCNLPLAVLQLASGKPVAPMTFRPTAIVRTLASHVVDVDCFAANVAKTA